MKIYAPAKVNLALDVVKQREDGYHELDMIMAPVSLYDELDVEIASWDEVVCDGLLLPENNTIIKMINLLKSEFDLTHSYKVVVKKSIPMEAGLAGGSADAAAVMKAILKLENLDVNLDTQLSLAKQIGADVPFCVVNQYARVKGIGEKIELINSSWKFDILLVKPDLGVSTPEAFRRWHQQEPMHPDVDYTQMACENESLDLLVQAMGNALEPAAFEIVPLLEELKNEMLDAGMVRVMMSGSGSTMMGFCADKEVLNKAYEQLKKTGNFVRIVTVG